jgi:hypothetical protein
MLTYDQSAHTLTIAATFSGVTNGAAQSLLRGCVPADYPFVIPAVTAPLPGFPTTDSGSYSGMLDLRSGAVWDSDFYRQNGGGIAAEQALANCIAQGQLLFTVYSYSFNSGQHVEITGYLSTLAASSTSCSAFTTTTTPSPTTPSPTTPPLTTPTMMTTTTTTTTTRPYAPTLSVCAALTRAPFSTSNGAGQASVVYDRNRHTLAISVSYSGLSGVPWFTVLQGCAYAGATGVVQITSPFANFPTSSTTGYYDGLLDLTDLSTWDASFRYGYSWPSVDVQDGAEPALARCLAYGQVYLNIYTHENPAGDIQGYLTNCDGSTTSTSAPSTLPPSAAYAVISFSSFDMTSVGGQSGLINVIISAVAAATGVPAAQIIVGNVQVSGSSVSVVIGLPSTSARDMVVTQASTSGSTLASNLPAQASAAPASDYQGTPVSSSSDGFFGTAWHLAVIAVGAAVGVAVLALLVYHCYHKSC